MSKNANKLSPLEAYEEVMRFAAKFGEAPLRLAFHAAVPQSFRPDLLHLLKRNFVPEARNETTTEADLLLSPLCRDIGRGYFQFDINVRYLLLDNLVKTYAADPSPRIGRIANFLLHYVNHFNRLTSGRHDRLWKDYLETQRWVALAFIDPEEAAHQFAGYLRQAVDEKEVVTRLHLGGLAASLAAPLAAYSPLLSYASALQTLETDGPEEALQKFGDFLDKEIVVGDITLRAASAIMRERYGPPPEPDKAETDFVEVPPDPSISSDIYDVYISYQYQDDEPTEAERSWIRQFHDALSVFLTERVGYKVKIFLNDHYSHENYSDAGPAKIFIAFVSPAYFDTRWPRHELENFVKETGGGRIYDRSRIFKVIKRPVPQNELPEILRELKGYSFEEFDERSGPFETINPNFEGGSRDRFLLNVSDLAFEIAEVLRLLDDGAPQPEEDDFLLNGFFNVPFEGKGLQFVGRREEMQHIRNLFMEMSGMGFGVCIEGVAGTGKTTLASEYAYELQHKYRAVFWFDGRKDIDAQLIAIGEKLEWVLPSETNAAETVRERIRRLSDCLFIFDDVDDQEAIKPYLPKAGVSSHVLVTSRNDQPGFHRIQLNLLPRADARELLQKRVGDARNREAEEETIDELLNELGYFPAAIVAAGEYLRQHPNVSFRAYLEILRDFSSSPIETYFSPGVLSPPQKIIIRSLKTGEKLLGENTRAREILDILTWSAEASMSRTLLSALSGSTDESAILNALGDALGAGLVKQEGNLERYSIHPLLARVRRLENPLENRKAWAQTIVRRLHEWGSSRLQASEIPAIEREEEHFTEWRKQVTSINPTEAIDLILLEARLNEQKAKYDEARFLLMKALELYQVSRSENKVQLETVYHSIGVIEYQLRSYESALNYLQMALEMSRQLNMPYEISSIYNRMGLIYHETAQYNEALEIYEKALQIQQELDSRHELISSLTNIASTYVALNRYPEALKHQHRAIELQIESGHYREPDFIRSLSNLSLIYSTLGNYKNALEYQQQALEICANIYGREHPSYAVELRSLGDIYRQQGSYDHATQYFEEAMYLARQTLGVDHPDYARSLISRALVYENQGRYKEALELFTEALQIFEKHLPENHPHLVQARKYVARRRNELKGEA